MRTKQLPFLVLVSALVLLLAACGAAPEADTVREGNEQTVVEEVAEVENEAPVAATAPAPPGSAALPSDAGVQYTRVAQSERMIIKNAEMQLLVSDTDVALDGIALIATEYGGYIVSSHTWSEDQHK